MAPNLNLNRIFQLGIRNKLVIAFIALSSVPLLLSGFYAIQIHTDTLQVREMEYLRREVLTVRERTSLYLKGAGSDIRFLGRSHLFQHFLQDPSAAATRRAFVQELIDLAISKRLYQISYLDGDGHVLVRVRSHQGRYSVLQGEKTGGRYYSLLIERLQRDELTLVPVELKNDEDGLVAAISCVLPVFADSSRPVGILVADLFASDFFRSIEETSDAKDEQIALVNREGYYLYHSRKKTRWNQLLASRQEHNLYRDYPREVARQILAPEAGVFIGTSEVFAHTPLLSSASAIMGSYALFTSIPRSIILAPVLRFRHIFYGLTIFFFILSIALAYLASAQFTRPISALKAEAQIIARGEYSHRLQLETYDEIQELAEMFNTMAAAIERGEAQIRLHQTQLETTVATRTREYLEEKEKLQTILDSVPSAFVVLDPALRIRSASRAFERISGHRSEEVVGQPYYRYFPDCGDGQACPAARARDLQRMVSDVEGMQLFIDDQLHHFERIAIPIVHHSETTVIIEVVTDVSERRKMEAQIIHSEKLATTGEMAAVIAHELRNSLTSVKMLIQLELEKELPILDRESLQVAAASVERMEGIVGQLLRFARPAPMRFAATDLNQIIEESIFFTQHQLERKCVHLHKNLAGDLPLLTLDGNQFKEVMVNLILNATQAVAEGGHIEVLSERGRGGCIDIAVKDDGPGISPENIERIFDPFFTTKSDGTGLGLSTSRRVVEEHGGSLTVRPTSRGAHFTIVLPADRKRIEDG